jgi:methyl-accepting chemotaxis protein
MFSLVQKIPQKYRIPLVAAVLPTLVILALTWSQVGDIRQRAIDACVSKARAVCLSAESVRMHAEHQWQQDIFQQTKLKEWANAGHTDHVMSTVPIISAMTSIQSSAKESGFDFKVPTLTPRNPANMADIFERDALAKLNDGNLEELIAFDEAHNTVHYFRPVRMSESCLKCHGNPTTSKELWGNDK